MMLKMTINKEKKILSGLARPEVRASALPSLIQWPRTGWAAAKHRGK